MLVTHAFIVPDKLFLMETLYQNIYQHTPHFDISTLASTKLSWYSPLKQHHLRPYLLQFLYLLRPLELSFSWMPLFLTCTVLCPHNLVPVISLTSSPKLPAFSHSLCPCSCIPVTPHFRVLTIANPLLGTLSPDVYIASCFPVLGSSFNPAGYAFLYI